MTFTSENILLIGSILIFCSIIIYRTGYRFGLPALLLFLIAGMIFGIEGVGIEFNNVHQTQFVGMAALCVILFTGGMETDFKNIKGVLGPGVTLSTVGVLLTTVLTGWFTFFLSKHGVMKTEMPFVICLLLAATMSSTDSASVFNVLRTNKMKIKGKGQPILELESGSNDPMAYVLTIVLISIAGSVTSGAEISKGLVAWEAIKVFLLQFIVGGGIGIGSGFLISTLINRIKLNNTPLYAILLLSTVFFVFSVTGMLEGNSYLAVYIAGIIIGNRKVPGRKQVLAFLDGMTWLMQICIFLILGLLADPAAVFKTAPVAIMIGLFLIFVARPFAVFLSLAPFRGIKFRSKVFISWVGLRGASPVIFATYPIIAGIPGSATIFNVVFFVTLLSLILQGSTIGKCAEWLRIALPDDDDNGFGIEIPDEVGDSEEYVITKSILKYGNTLKELKVPEGKLVILVKRGQKNIVPNGHLQLKEGDRLLIISVPDEEKKEPESPFITK